MANEWGTSPEDRRRQDHWRRVWETFTPADKRGPMIHPVSLTVVVAVFVGFPLGVLAAFGLELGVPFYGGLGGFSLFIIAGIVRTRLLLRARERGKESVLPPRLLFDIVFWLPLIALGALIGTAGAATSIDLAEPALSGALMGGAVGVGTGGLIGTGLHMLCVRLSRRRVREIVLERFFFAGDMSSRVRDSDPGVRSRMLTGAIRHIHRAPATWDSIGRNLMEALERALNRPESFAEVDAIGHADDGPQARLKPHDPENLPDLRVVLEEEFLRLLKTEMDLLEFNNEVRRNFARRVIANAEELAPRHTREAVTIEFHRAVARHRADVREFRDSLREEVRAPLEARFLSLLEKEMDALHWPLATRRACAVGTVRLVLWDAWSSNTPIEEGFQLKVQSVRARLRQEFEEHERERPVRKGGPRTLEEEADFARTRMSLQRDFVERMRDACDRAAVPVAEREGMATWLLALVRGKADARTPAALRSAFDQQMGIEGEATRFLRDPANAGRTCPELEQVRIDFAILYDSNIQGRLGDTPMDHAVVGEWAARAIERAEKAAAENPWLPLHVAFQLQVAADTAKADRFAKEGAARPATAPMVPDRTQFDQKRLAVDWMMEAGRLEKIGDYDGAKKLLNRARRTSLGIGDSAGVARAHLLLARLARARGFDETARQEYDHALEVYRRLDQPETVVMVQTERGVVGLSTRKDAR